MKTNKIMTVTVLILAIAIASFGVTTAQAGKMPNLQNISKIFSTGFSTISFAPKSAELAEGTAGGFTFTGPLQKFDLATAQYIPFDGEATFGAGSCFFTGPDTSMTLNFSNTSFAVVGPNSEFCISAYSVDPATGVITITFDLGIGTADFTIDEAPGAMAFTLQTPTGVTTNENGSLVYSAEVVFPGTEGMTPEQLQAWIADQPIFMEKEVTTDANGNLVLNDGAIVTKLLPNYPDVQVITEETTPAPAATAAATIVAPTATPKPTDVAGHCGNGVCEPYKGEDTLTCSADCAP